ncbi:ubiquitin-conjugating enzyme E2 C isoform X1 [Opisthocomus hoazin]|uniref:ubiquitin-conjugating enzyme E2 C isoform X1 n=1 Tax=Opisthocomus hoazin TaxID=30419 RepID=UPI003F539F65
MASQNADPAAVPSAAARKATEAGATAARGSVGKRLQQELMALMMSGDKGISAFPESDNLFKWIGTIDGAAGTRVPLRRAHRALPDPLLPPQRGPPGQHLPRHPQGQVVGALRRPHHPALHPEPAGRAQRGEPPQHARRRALEEPSRLQEVRAGDVRQAGQEPGDLTRAPGPRAPRLLYHRLLLS